MVSSYLECLLWTTLAFDCHLQGLHELLFISRVMDQKQYNLLGQQSRNPMFTLSKIFKGPGKARAVLETDS